MFEFQDYLRASSSVQLLLAFGERFNIQKVLLLESTGLSLARLNDANCVVTSEQEKKVISNLIDQLPIDPTGIGLVIGFQHKLTTYGILGYAMMSSATGLDAFKLVKRFLPLTYTFVKISFRQENDQAIISFTEPAGISMTLQTFVLERAMAATSRIISDIYDNRFKLDEFNLKSPKPPLGSIAVPEQFLGTSISFDQKNNELKFKAIQLASQLPHANNNTAAMCERLCTELINQRYMTLTTTMIVRDFLMNAPYGVLFNLNHVADKLNMSERTLKRRLNEENTSFRNIQNETLCQRANIMLSKKINLTQIAETLGFSDLSTFSQAYKRWTGIAPSRYNK
jgi:AraC-like DNA-binding protein